MKTIYTISKKEINRRKTAYTTLIISFFLSSIAFTFNYIMQYLNIFIYIILIVGTFLFISRIIVIKYLNSLSEMNVELNSIYIIKNKTKYFIKHIKKIIIKRTINGCIREIKIYLVNNTSTYIDNSMNNIEDFIIKLKKQLSKEVINKTIQEPINYDHPTFYFFFGIIISFVSIGSIKLLFDLNTLYLKLTSCCISFLAIIMGIYFIAYKPIYKRNEKTGQIADYIWGGFFIIGAVLILISSIF